MKILCPPLAKEIRDLFVDADEIYIVSPWVKHDALIWALDKNLSQQTAIHVLMSGNLEDFVNQTSDIDAVEWLLAIGANVRLVSNLHAKIYLSDSSHAIVTSSNLTSAGIGLSRGNVEVGILVDDETNVSALKEIVASWLDEGTIVDSEWIHRIRKAIDTSQNQETAQKAQIEKQRLQRAGSRLAGKRIRIRRIVKQKSASSFPSVDKVLSEMFNSRAECEAGIRYFSDAVEVLPSTNKLKHIISTTFRQRERKLTLNIGNWEVFCIRRQRNKSTITFSIDRLILPEVRTIDGFLQEWEFASRWSGDGSFSLLQFKWDYQEFSPSERFFQAWYSSIHHAAKVFEHWRASSYMRAHHPDILKLFTNDEFRDATLAQVFPK